MLSIFKRPSHYIPQKELKRLRGEYIRRPGEDEYDVIHRTSEWEIGLFVFWTAGARGLRWLSRSIVRAAHRLADAMQPKRLALPPPLLA